MARFLMLVALVLSLVGGRAHGDTINVAAAISLQDALKEIAADFEKSTGHSLKFSFGSSGQLAAQMKAGAPIDVFISAAAKQADDVIAAGAADKSSRVVVAGNALVLIAPPGDQSMPLNFEQIADERVTRIAIGDPATVPAGQYAKESLDHLKLWDRVKDRIVFGTNVRAVLDFVIRGEVAAGIVYRSDALEAGEKVRVVATADAKWHSAIEYVGVTASKSGAAPAEFLKHLRAEHAQAVLARHGFSSVEP